VARAVVLAGGWAHSPDPVVQASHHLAAPLGFEIEVVTTPDEAEAALDAACDLLIVGACWFGMHDDRYSDTQRSEFAVAFTPELEQALGQQRAAGCPLLALHTAVICFDAAPLWVDWLGGTWNWQTSWHPEPAEITVHADLSPLGAEEELSNPFVVVDELYQGLDVSGSSAVVATSADGHPLSWVKEDRHGKTAVNLLGHSTESLGSAGHTALNQALVRWLVASPPSTA
jgi:hypothetical protein